MIEYKSLIDETGKLIERCILCIDGTPQEIVIKNGYMLVERCDINGDNLVWDGTSWKADDEYKETSITENIDIYTEIKELKERLNKLEMILNI